MNELCMIIKDMVKPNFLNIRTSNQTYDKEAIFNGQTTVTTGKFPMWVSQSDKYVDDGILFGRYRKGQVTK